jgi:5'-3' exonuclease
MGVPTYFFWLVSRFEHIILNTSYPYSSASSSAPDILYFDLNCAIHPAVKDDITLTESQMYDAVLKYIDNIMEFVKPTKGVFLAIDGVAPKAKMDQQRARRYKSITESRQIHEIKLKHKQPIRDTPVDFNMISPGTEFMLKLSDKIKEHIKFRKTNTWRGLDVWFSDSSVPGEGEHKIMNHIRETSTVDEDSKIAIYGLDSDLIFLSLLNYRRNTVLVREKSQFENKFQISKTASTPFVYLDIDELRDVLTKIMCPLSSLTELEGVKIFNDLLFTEPPEAKKSHYIGTDSDKLRLIRDYVFICFMLGNDFVPNLPSLKIREGGLNTLVQTYKVVSWEYGSYLVNDDGVTIDNRFFIRLLEILEDTEDSFLKSLTDTRDERISRFMFRLRRMEPFEREMEEMGYVENKYFDSIKMGYEGWNERYYRYHLHLKRRHKDELERQIYPIVVNYVQGLKWILQYYNGNMRNWSWSYKYPVAPTMRDLLYFYKNTRNNIDINKISFSNDQPPSAFTQLLAILPPDSVNLLPPHLHHIIRSTEFHMYYPIKVRTPLLGKKFLWECEPALPNIPIDRLERTVSLLNRRATGYNKKLNCIGKLLRF